MRSVSLGLLALKILTLAVGVLMLQACAEVSPWERGNLAKAQMALDSAPAQNRLRSHIFESREAASGGHFGVGGGGCGCN